MHRRKSSISSKGDDCFLDSIGNQGQQPQVVPNGNQGQRPPQVIFVSALGELQSALIERDARIAFLEKELVDTRLQLALAKTSEDRLVMELNKANKMSLELAEATKRNSSICFVSEDDDSDRSARLSTLSEQRPAVASPDEVNKPGNTIRAPVLTRQIRRDIGTSRKRGADEEPTTNSSYWQNLNPASCASGLRLLEGDIASGGSISTRRMSSNGVNNNIMWAPAMNSTTSINRHLGNMGLSIYSSEDFLKKRKIGKNKLGNKVQKNEEWVIAPPPPRYQPLPMGRKNPTTTSSVQVQRRESQE